MKEALPTKKVQNNQIPHIQKAGMLADTSQNDNNNNNIWHLKWHSRLLQSVHCTANCCTAVVNWLLNILVTCLCTSATDLRQIFPLPHWEISCRSNLLSHSVTEYWHSANQLKYRPHDTRRQSGEVLEYQSLSLVWLNPEKSPGS